MRHRRQTKRFNRNPKERKAMLENLVASLLTHQQITTTLEKAKEARKLADKMIPISQNPGGKREFDYVHRAKKL